MAKSRDVIIVAVLATAFIFAMVAMMVALAGFSDDSTSGFGVGIGGGVGVVEISGVLDESSGRPIIRQLDRWKKNDNVKAVVLHINSPGGGVAISQEIYDAIKRVSDVKPVVAAFASVSASGGYYIACAADKIVANPGTITGSIGVIFQFYTFEGLMGKVGVTTQTVKSGELKDVGNISRPMTEREELMLKSVVMDSYEQFVEVVATGRDMEKEEIYTLADGSIYTGSQAYHLGLVDTLGGLTEAISLAADLSGLTGEPDIIRQPQKSEGGIFDRIESVLGRVDHSISASMKGPQLLYIFE